MPGVFVDEAGNIHLLESYSTAATRTLCGVPVPQLWGAERGNVHWAHAGHETCSQCRAVRTARREHPTPPQTVKARPLSRIVKR